MKPQDRIWSCFFSFVLICISGCSSDSDQDNEIQFPDLQVTDKKPPTNAVLQVNLKVGDQFPLQKIVRQELTLLTPDGDSVSSSELSILLTITVEKIEAGKRLLAVRYQSVRYSHNIAGETVQFDSTQPTNTVPAAARPYLGLVNNELKFWLGTNNQIIELVDFERFVQRCVAAVPVNQQAAVHARMSEMTGSDGIADFVDDSIGLLPTSTDGDVAATVVSLNQKWKPVARRIRHPVPMSLQTTCTLKQLTEKVAQIGIEGTISPDAQFGPVGQFNQGLQLSLNSGSFFGECTIDRATGLPIESQIERRLNMTVHMGQGVRYEQRKRILTIIRAFPSQGAPTLLGATQPTRRMEPTDVTARPVLGQPDINRTAFQNSSPTFGPRLQSTQ